MLANVNLFDSCSSYCSSKKMYYHYVEEIKRACSFRAECCYLDECVRKTKLWQLLLKRCFGARKLCSSFIWTAIWCAAGVPALINQPHISLIAFNDKKEQEVSARSLNNLNIQKNQETKLPRPSFFIPLKAIVVRFFCWNKNCCN